MDLLGQNVQIILRSNVRLQSFQGAHRKLQQYGCPNHHRIPSVLSSSQQAVCIIGLVSRLPLVNLNGCGKQQEKDSSDHIIVLYFSVVHVLSFKYPLFLLRALSSLMNTFWIAALPEKPFYDLIAFVLTRFVSMKFISVVTCSFSSFFFVRNS